MTVASAAEGIEIGGFREWLPLPLDGVGADYVDEMVEHFAQDTISRDTVRRMVAALVGVGQQLADTSDDDALMIGAWTLLPPGGDQLELRGLVTMTCQRVAESTTAEEYIEQMAREVRLFQPPEVSVLDTKSGPAHMVRLRQHEDSHGSVAISEIAVCFWLPAALPGVAVVLSSTMTPDLIAAADLAQAMQPLAESVRGL